MVFREIYDYLLENQVKYDGTPETAVLSYTTHPIGWAIIGISLIGLSTFYFRSSGVSNS